MLWSRVRLGSVCLLSVTLVGTTPAHAQDEAAPLPAPPEPAPPPATPPPSDAVPTPDAPPAPAAPAPSAPPAADFPLPPASPPAAQPPTAKKPATRPVEPPPATTAPATPPEPAWQTKPATPPAAPPPAEPIRHHEDDDEESVDQFKIGPVVGVGIPSIFSFGGTLKLTRYLGAGINIGLIPKVQLDYYGKATLSYQHYDIYGRIYPFGGGFFLSGGAGYATVDGTLSSSYSSGPMVINGFQIPGGTATYSGTGTVRTLMLTALIGYFYTTSVGFSIGVDAGAQIPIAPSQVSFSSGVTPPEAATLFATQKKDADDSVRSTLEKIGRTPLPTLNLRIGWIL